MPTLITKDMPEPKEYGPYLIATKDGKPLFIAHHRKSGPSTAWSDIEMKECSWYELRVVVDGYTVEGGCTIESLADHDARIRREALTFTEEECDVFTVEADKEGAWFATFNIRKGLEAVAKWREAKQ